jgi:hypothetical protein
MARYIDAHLNMGLPEELYEKVKKHPEIKWGAVARAAVIKYLKMIEEAKRGDAPESGKAKA